MSERFDPRLLIAEIHVTHNVRRHFDGEALAGLAESIKACGIQEPLIVRPVEQGYELVAGERRLRAAQMAELTTVPVIVRDMDSSTAARLQLLENLQRKDLDPVEEAEGFERLIRDHGLRAKEIARQLGVSEPYISNRRRLLKLPQEALDNISHEKLSSSVALSLVEFAGNAELTQRLAGKLVEKNATQQQAPEVIAETLATTCPIVATNGYVYGNENRTCDADAHKDCPCRRHVKPRYSSEMVVCVDPQHYAEVEGAAQAKIDAKKAKALAKAEASDDGILDLKALKWTDYGREAQYHDVTSPYGDPKACDGDHTQCACLRHARGPHENEHVRLICIDPKAFNKIERQTKREQTKTAMADLQTENEKLSTWALGEVEELMSEGLTTILGHPDLAYLAAWVLSSCDVHNGPTGVPRADRKKYLEGLGIEIKFGSSYLQSQRREIADAFMAATPDALLRIIYEWPLIAQGNAPYALGHWYRAQIDPEVTEAEKAAVTAALGEIYGDEDEPGGDLGDPEGDEAAVQAIAQG